MTKTTFNRRDLAKGAAWATPVIVASSAVPVYAASRCGQLGRTSSNGFSPNTYSDGYHKYKISFGMMGVNSLPPGVTVEKVSVTWYMSHKDFRWLNNTTGTGNGGEIQVTGNAWGAFPGSTGSTTFIDSKNSNWLGNRLTYNQNGALGNRGPAGTDVAHDYTSYTNTWTPQQTGNPASRRGVYSDAGNGCRNFRIAEMGEFHFRERTATSLYNDNRWRAWSAHEITLSTGQVLLWYSWDPKYTPEFGSSGFIRIS